MQSYSVIAKSNTNNGGMTMKMSKMKQDKTRNKEIHVAEMQRNEKFNLYEEKAYELIKKAGMWGTVPVDTVKLAETFDISVAEADLKENEDGFILINVKREDPVKLIVVNKGRMPDKKRFIIAHELGHFRMECEEGGHQIYAMRDGGHGRSEEENYIDYFAACLLMPRDIFRAEFDKRKKDKSIDEIVKELATLFKVPKESALRRLQEIGAVRLQ